MAKENNAAIYSGASAKKVEEDLQPLVDFKEQGLSIKEITELVKNRLVPHLMQYSRPEFQSMFNAFPEEGAKLGAKIALEYNQGVTNWQVSPGGAMLEELCCRALCRLFGFPPDSDATFMYCGTYANQEALYLALHRHAQKHGFNFAKKGLKGFDEPSRLKVLTSCDAHFSLKHAVRMLGLGEESLVPLAVDKNRRIDISLMEKTVAALHHNTDIFCVVATAGTTSTGSVDPILSMAKICSRLDAWLHVDGAYGLAYSLVPEYKYMFRGIELADSVSWDPHKQMGVPIPNSLLFVHRREDFNRMSLYSDYFNLEGTTEPNPGLKSPPSTRPMSALPLVTSLLYQGMANVTQRLRSPLKAVKETADYLKHEPDIELCLEPDTGILCFRVIPEGFPEDKLDHLQQYIYDKIMSEGKRSISLSKLDNKTILRLAAISPFVTNKALMETISNVKALAGEYPH